ncbi:histidinol dehydrogenase [Aminivibrio sp.]|jgi:histidinol dehydrogenase/sulfopropanediol 3-dehydrogenase|uniref:histidinol dehydrogenase n=1 Tax=Aminivibrio sp. TaxID=1872489 RepID=UPI001A3C75BB|nr:histidinol dehydrogenase [Aminivibrio sp.]MBL3538525.1 histidinol dehydrogenase [Aminivibrio sp.]MDK2958106.1 sulfopropanediol 3-dehydrogenase [Synergistaceae bacterium]
MIVLKEAKKRGAEGTESVEKTVRDILKDVRSGGDEAVRNYTEKFDGFRPASLRVDEKTVREAYSKVSQEMVETLQFAARRIRDFAVKQKECMKELRWEISPGVVLGHRLIPVASCGCYVPAGRYPLPSSALMSAIPAKVAGVKRIAACSPASRGQEGIHPAVLVAMDIAGVDEIYCMGGAQAVGAFAFGTETLEPVDIITGPGNRYVTEAKRQVSGSVGIDMLAGPSEVVIIADGSAPPEWVAADALARCEHDPNSWTVIVTTSRKLAEKTAEEILRQAEGLPTGKAALEAWQNNGRILLADSLEEAVKIADGIAPEHLQVMTENSLETAEKLTNFGSLFIGPYAPVAFGDYVSGPNHILPTARCARFSNGVYAGTFIKVSSYQEITREGAYSLAEKCAAFADMEGLFGHKRSAELRKKDGVSDRKEE